MDSENDSSLFVNFTLPYLPDDWCFNMEMWIHSEENINKSQQMRAKYAHYKDFSYHYNGILTLILIGLGFTGSSLLLKQIYGSRVFSKRLAVHLGMICFWDILYLLSCLSTYCLPSLLYQVTPIYGPFSYVLIFLQPFASFCVSCTIWQVFAITLERYLAVSSPLEQRTRKAKFGVGWICLAIVIGAFIVNLLPVPFENELVDCYEISFSPNGTAIFQNHTMMKPHYEEKIRLYRFFVHFFPDLIFRAPVPIIVIGTLTVRTIQACSQRSVGNFQIGMRLNRNMPLRLSLLNFKFILCNTLYMFNTILLELLEYGNMANGDYDGYINSFYLTDASNMLLVVHSATNWLLFYNLPSCSKKDGVSVAINTSLKRDSIKYRIADFINKAVSPIAPVLGMDIVQKLCDTIPDVESLIIGEAKGEKEVQERVSAVGTSIGDFICQVFKWFGERNKKKAHKIIYQRYTQMALKAKVNFKPNEWKIIRSIVVASIIKNIPTNKLTHLKFQYKTEEVEECATRVFNLVLSEMRNGALCANVEEKLKCSRNERMQRSNSTTATSLMLKEVQRKSHSVSMRFQYSTSVDSTHGSEQQHLIEHV